MSTDELIVADSAGWRDWLGEHHQDSQEVWVVLARKGVTEPTSLRYAEAVDEALCYGWIDSHTRSRDDSTYLQRYSPRRNRSSWSRRNVANVERLQVAGRMHRAGQAEVERAQLDGRWDPQQQ